MRPFFGKEEREIINKYNFEDAFLTEFSVTKTFENALKDLLGVKFTHAVTSGTTALLSVGGALGIKEGDEILIPNFTMIATPNAFRILGAIPVFCDIEQSTLCISIDEIMKKKSAKTRAVILVNANGRYPSYDVDELRTYLNKDGIFLIEDAAQSLGSKYPDGAPIGTKANVGILSFSPPKIISTGQGGLVFTDNEEISAEVKRFKDFGRDSGGNDIHQSFGLNFKFTDLQALVGLAQLKKLQFRCERRKHQTLRYREVLSRTAQVRLGKDDLDYTVPWFNEIFIDNPNKLQQHLKTKNIGTRKVYPEINKQKLYYQTNTLKNSNKISNTGLWLPSHMGVTDEIIEIIGDTIVNFLKK